MSGISLHSPPRRPASVTASAVVALAGSVLAIPLALVVLATGAEADATLAGGRTIARLMAGTLAAGAVSGCVTAWGLLRLREWARVVILVFAGMLVLFAGVSLLAVLALPLPDPGAGGGGTVGALRALFAAFYAVPVAIGVWWLVLFTRPAVIGSFASGARGGPGSLPLEITFLAWATLAGGLLCVGPLLTGAAFFLPGAVLTGWLAGMAYAALALMQLYCGWGLLRSDARARRLAIGFFSATVLYGALGLLVPGLADAARSATLGMVANIDPALSTELDALWWSVCALVVIALAVPVWMLVRWQGPGTSTADNP